MHHKILISKLETVIACFDLEEKMDNLQLVSYIT